MPGKAIKIGPFTGGLNNTSTAGESRDNELLELVNMEVAKDESLTSRAPLTIVPGSTKYYAGGNANMGYEILGIYRVSNLEWYLVVMSATTEASTDAFQIKAYRSGIIGTASESSLVVKTLTGVTNKVTGMTQFKDELYFITGPGSTQKGFRWKKDIAAVDIDIPKGTVVISWKSRIWVTGTLSGANADRIWFSYVGAQGPEPARWEATDFFDIAPGEGGYITSIIPSFNNLIVFKSDGTWRFSYPSSPKQGSVDKISGQVGAASKSAAIEFENYIYVYDQGYIYELVNSNFSQLNSFVQFKEDPLSVDGTAPGVELSIVNRRLIVRYFNAIYVFTVDTKAWSVWRSYNGTPGKFQELPVDSSRAEASSYMAVSRGSFQNPTLNLLKNTSATVPANGVVYLNGVNDTEYTTPVTPYQKFDLSYNVLTVGSGSAIRIKFRKSDGVVTTIDTAFTAVGKKSTEITIPQNALLAQVSVITTSGTQVAEVSFSRKSSASPSMLLATTDRYLDTPNPVEYIEMSMLTKTFDYQAATSFKRLFYWGADLVTPNPIYAEARPVGKKNTVTWGELQAFTWKELSQGTWKNPLSWRNRSTSVVSMTSANVDISENGRFYVKLAKNLRFRQIAFYLRLTTFGNTLSGPAKIFGLTTLVSPKKDTIDTAT